MWNGVKSYTGMKYCPGINLGVPFCQPPKVTLTQPNRCSTLSASVSMSSSSSATQHLARARLIIFPATILDVGLS